MAAHGNPPGNPPHPFGFLPGTSGRAAEGAFYHNRIDGYGTMYYDNGDRHEGFWTDNRAHGLGFSVRADDPYEGAWQADLYAKGRVAIGGKYNVQLHGPPVT